MHDNRYGQIEDKIKLEVQFYSERRLNSVYFDMNIICTRVKNVYIQFLDLQWSSTEMLGVLSPAAYMMHCTECPKWENDTYCTNKQVSI